MHREEFSAVQEPRCISAEGFDFWARVVEVGLLKNAPTPGGPPSSNPDAGPHKQRRHPRGSGAHPRRDGGGRTRDRPGGRRGRCGGGRTRRGPAAGPQAALAASLETNLEWVEPPQWVGGGRLGAGIAF